MRGECKLGHFGRKKPNIITLCELSEELVHYNTERGGHHLYFCVTCNTKL